jgi:TetR/AcrR family transcriptional regulator
MATAPLRYSAADRRQQILDAALALFARRGFQGTTTRQIADAARVNEAIIFRHFPSKEDLYWAVLQRECENDGGIGTVRQELQASSSHVREVFTRMARQILERRSRDATLSRLLLFSGLESHRLSRRFFRTYMAEYFQELASHIRTGIEAGRFRAVDPMLAARGFVGMIVYHAWVQELFASGDGQSFDNTEVARSLTDIWLSGILPAEQRAPGRAAKSSRNAISRVNGKANAAGR